MELPTSEISKKRSPRQEEIWVSGMFRMFRKCLEIKNSRSRTLTFVLLLFHSLLKALESIAIIDLSVIRLLRIGYC